MPTSTINVRAYDAIASLWDKARRDFFGREREHVDTLLATAGQGGTVLDLGCGTGRPIADYVVSRGYRVIGVDQSREMLAVAAARHPSQRWVHASMESYVADAPCTAAILWDSLFHIERDRHEFLLKRVVSGLPAGGRVMITVGGSAHPAFTDEMFGETFFYDSNTPDETLALLARLGCDPVVAEYMNPPTAGRDKGRYAIIASKR